MVSHGHDVEAVLNEARLKEDVEGVGFLFKWMVGCGRQFVVLVRDENEKKREKGHVILIPWVIM